MTSPLDAYHDARQHLGFVADPAQEYALEQLQHCFLRVHDNTTSARGVYLFGPVGRGKTWLMDAFFRHLRVPARRQHFHHFMRWVHQRLFALQGSPDPLRTVAAELRTEIAVLCFDELFVNDIGDAILLGRLFQLLFDHGIVIVCTSNSTPDELYLNGFNRDRFEPAIAAIKTHMQIVGLGAGMDHRLHSDTPYPRYWLHSTPSPLWHAFRQQAPTHDATSCVLRVNGQTLTVLAHSPTAVLCTFEALCEQPFAAADFIALCDRFSTIFLHHVPRLGGMMQAARIARGTEDAVTQVHTGDRHLPTLARHDDSVRRFIALVDECYDRRIPLFIEAEVPLDQLYTEGYLLAPFQRTLSRLREMQWQRYGRSP